MMISTTAGNNRRRTKKSKRLDPSEQRVPPPINESMMLSQIESLIGLDEVAQFSLTVHAFHLEFSLTSCSWTAVFLHYACAE